MKGISANFSQLSGFCLRSSSLEVRTEAAGVSTASPQWHKGLISQMHLQSHGSWSAGSGDFPGTKAGLRCD